MIRQLILSAAVGTALVLGITMTPASADAHPPAVVPVYRPAYHPAHVHPHHNHHHALFGVQLYVPPPSIIVERPIYFPAPVVVVPAPTCPPAPVVIYRR